MEHTTFKATVFISTTNIMCMTNDVLVHIVIGTYRLVVTNTRLVLVSWFIVIKIFHRVVNKIYTNESTANCVLTDKNTSKRSLILPLILLLTISIPTPTLSLYPNLNQISPPHSPPWLLSYVCMALR